TKEIALATSQTGFDRILIIVERVIGGTDIQVSEAGTLQAGRVLRQDSFRRSRSKESGGGVPLALPAWELATAGLERGFQNIGGSLVATQRSIHHGKTCGSGWTFDQA